MRGATLAVVGRSGRGKTALAFATEDGKQFLNFTAAAFGTTGIGIRRFHQLVKGAMALQTLELINRHFIMIQRIMRFVNIFF
jgi:ABC-type dipeptide/oligopeptide/nickel transport system ATPase subunit